MARLVGVSAPTVHEWKTNRRPVPVIRCADIIRISGGLVTRQELRPNDWHLIWPELATDSPAQASTTAAGATHPSPSTSKEATHAR